MEPRDHNFVVVDYLALHEQLVAMIDAMIHYLNLHGLLCVVVSPVFATISFALLDYAIGPRSIIAYAFASSY